MAAFPPVAGHPSVIVIHGHDPQATDLENLIDGLKDKGYNVYLFVYEKAMIPHTPAGPFTAANLETFVVRSLDDLTKASSALADAANFLFANDSTINLIGFSLGGVVARGATVFFPDHPEQRTLASNDPNAKRVNLVTVDSPLGGMDMMIATGPRVGAFFSGIFNNFYSPFRNASQWYLNGRTGPNVHHALGSNLGDDVVSHAGQQLPNGMKPDSAFQTTGSHVGSISNPGNVRIIVNTLEELNGRKVSMSTSQRAWRAVLRLRRLEVRLVRRRRRHGLRRHQRAIRDGQLQHLVVQRVVERERIRGGRRRQHPALPEDIPRDGGIGTKTSRLSASTRPGHGPTATCSSTRPARPVSASSPHRWGRRSRRRRACG